MRQPFALVLSAALLPLLLCAQDEQAKQVDAISQQWNNASGPGAAVSVIQDGHTVLERGYGLANLEYDLPIRPDTIFHVASVS